MYKIKLAEHIPVLAPMCAHVRPHSHQAGFQHRQQHPESTPWELMKQCHRERLPALGHAQASRRSPRPLAFPSEAATLAPRLSGMHDRICGLQIRDPRAGKAVPGVRLHNQDGAELVLEPEGAEARGGEEGRAPTILVPVLAAGADPAAQHLDVLPAGPAVELVQPQLLTAHIVPSPRLVLHVDAEVHVLLGRQHLAGERGISYRPWKLQVPCT